MYIKTSLGVSSLMLRSVLCESSFGLELKSEQFKIQTPKLLTCCLKHLYTNFYHCAIFKAD